MKKKIKKRISISKIKTPMLLALVLIALTGLVFIQFLWIYRAALRHEKQFEYTVMASLGKSVLELDKKEVVCSEVVNCFNQKGYSHCNPDDIALEKWKTIERLIHEELVANRIDIDYTFSLSTHDESKKCKAGRQHKSFSIKTNMITNTQLPIWIHVEFPDRNAFIIAQMGGLFIAGLFLIAIIALAFFLVYRNYKHELQLAANTRNFINNLTHELKTPISTIRLANSRINKNLPDDSALSNYPVIIEEETRKINENINYLLDLSRLQKGKLPVMCTYISVHDTLQGVLNGFQLLADEQNGKLQWKFEANEDVVYADCFHLSNLFNNLLDNAFKYSNEMPNIDVITRNTGNSIEVEVQDRGIGIKKQDLKLIFGEFSRVSTGDVHNVKGFGLGLAYVWQIVQIFNGSIKVESQPGEGSVFTVQLPLRRPNEE